MGCATSGFAAASAVPRSRAATIPALYTSKIQSCGAVHDSASQVLLPCASTERWGCLPPWARRTGAALQALALCTTGVVTLLSPLPPTAQTQKLTKADVVLCEEVRR